MWQTYDLYSNIPKNAISHLFTQGFKPKLKYSKRIFDILFSSFVLLLLFPLFLLIALIIKVTSPGPVFYWHKRVKMGGVSFYLLKFRTMYQDADAKVSELLGENPTFKKEWEEFRKIKNDPRVTPFGKLLRKISLDELPQFYNALKGDLSIVGPRPVKEEEIIAYYKENAAKILSVRPGVTGLWQVSGRNHLSMKERVSLESAYVDKQSFFLDLYLIAKTIPAMLFSKGAY